MDTEDSLTLTTGNDSLTGNSSTLTPILSENDELKSFMEENPVLLKQISLQLQDTILECEQSFKMVQSKLQALEERLPQIISEAELIKKSIDQKHKTSTKATIAGSSTSLLGGALIVGGILVSSFTYGASLGFTVTGAILAGAGGVTTAGAKVFDLVQANKGYAKVRKLIKEVELLCKEVQSEYEELQQLCEKLGDHALKVCPALHVETCKEKMALGWNILGFFWHSSSAVSTTAVTTGVNSEVAIAFIHAVGLSMSGGEPTGAIAPFSVLNVTMKAVETVIVVAGIILNAATVEFAAHQLISDVLQWLCEILYTSVLEVCLAKIPHGWWTIFGFFWHLSSAVSTLVRKGVCNKVAYAFIHAVGFSMSGGETKGSTAPFIILNVIRKAVGTVVVVAGITFNAVTVGYATCQLIKDKNCPTSERIAKETEQLKALQNRIKKELQEK